MAGTATQTFAPGGKHPRAATVTDDKVKAELFNEYFASVRIVDNGVQPVCTDFINCIKSLDTVEFSTFDVAIVMSKLKSIMSSGPGGLLPILFKKLAARLAEVLSIAFTQLMSGNRTTKKEGSRHHSRLKERISRRSS